MKIKDVLATLGLHPNEIKLYLTLLEIPPAGISELAQRTGLHRPLIYRSIPALKDKGLLSITSVGKRKRYAAESPEQIRRLFQELQGSLNPLLIDLETAYLAKERRPIFTFLEGRKGITAVFTDLLHTLKRGDVFYRYSSGRDVKKNETYLPKNYRELRDQKKLERFVITNEKTAAEKRKRLERALKIMPATTGQFEYNVTQLIYGSKIAFIDYNSETSLILENPVMAKFQAHLFKVLFDKL